MNAVEAAESILEKQKLHCDGHFRFAYQVYDVLELLLAEHKKLVETKDTTTLSKDAANALLMYLKGELIYSSTNIKLARNEQELSGAIGARQHIKDLISLLESSPARTL